VKLICSRWEVHRQQTQHKRTKLC